MPVQGHDVGQGHVLEQALVLDRLIAVLAEPDDLHLRVVTQELLEEGKFFFPLDLSEVHEGLPLGVAVGPLVRDDLPQERDRLGKVAEGLARDVGQLIQIVHLIARIQPPDTIRLKTSA